MSKIGVFRGKWVYVMVMGLLVVSLGIGFHVFKNTVTSRDPIRSHFEQKATMPASSTPYVATVLKTTGTYVASKMGKAYYFPWCGTAKRIAEKNKIWFETREEAEKAGYTVGKNCKGLK